MVCIDSSRISRKVLARPSTADANYRCGRYGLPLEIMRRFASGPDERFLIDDYEPVYFRTWREGGLNAKVEATLDALVDCRACPRDCRINRRLDLRWR
jgi:hypothetical protein